VQNPSLYVWNVMAHAQKPDLVFRRNGRVHLNRQGPSVQWTTGSRGVRISGSNAGYTMLRGRVKSTGYPLHLPVSPSLPLQCVTVCHHVSNELYHLAHHKSQTDVAWQAANYWPEPCHGLKTADMTNYTSRFRAYLTENTVCVH